MVYLPTPASCNNLGVQYAFMTNPYTRSLSSDDPTYSSFAAAAFQTETPSVNGSTDFVQVPHQASGSEVVVYGNANQSMDHVAIVHRGYLYARLTGNYTFTFPLSDDISLLWIGSNSKNGL